MKTIWKFPLTITYQQKIQMPQGAEILVVACQDERPCIWAIVDPVAPVEDRVFQIFGTGHQMSESMGVDRKFLGTAFCPPSVWHVFEWL